MARETITSLDMLRDEDARFGTKPAVPAIAKDLKALGSGTVYSYEKPDASLLETFPNPLLNGNKNWSGSINIVSPEFTSLCPKTGQPDFATIIIDYIPKDKCVESKSLKLYLGSFRMHGEFHESCVQRIASDLVELLDPQWLKVKGEFTPRGGIPFWPEVSYFAGGGDVHPAENIGSCSA